MRLRPLIALLITAIVPLVGCASRSAPLTVEVRDQQSHAPIGEAWVQVRPVHLFLPEEPFALVDPSPEPGNAGWTDAQGTVELDAVVDHPFYLHVLAEGYRPLQMERERHPLVHGRSPWLTEKQRDLEDDLPRLEVRLIEPRQSRPEPTPTSHARE